VCGGQNDTWGGFFRVVGISSGSVTSLMFHNHSFIYYQNYTSLGKIASWIFATVSKHNLRQLLNDILPTQQEVTGSTVSKSRKKK
jgi:hypothetical protein